MSFQAMTWATSQELPAMQKIVLLMLANRTNHDTGRCDPSHEKLAKDCGMSVRSAKDQIAKLEAAGLLTIVHRKVENVSIPNQYVLHLDSVPVRQETPEGGAGGARRVGQEVPTKQEVKPVSKTKTKTHIPENFCISERVEKWAMEKGFKDLPLHLENFISQCRARGYAYVDWDDAFMNAIRGDWARTGDRRQSNQGREPDRRQTEKFDPVAYVNRNRVQQ